MVYKMKTHILGKDPIFSVVGAPIRWHTVATFPSKHDWIDKTVIPFQAHEGWTGYALKDWKAAYKGAKICCEGAIRSNSAGGNQLITGEMDVQKCLRQATKEVSCQ